MPRTFDGITRVKGAKVSWLFVFFCLLETFAWTQATYSSTPDNFLKGKTQFGQSRGLNVDIVNQVTWILDGLYKLQSDRLIVTQVLPVETPPRATPFDATDQFKTLYLENLTRNPRKAARAL